MPPHQQMGGQGGFPGARGAHEQHPPAVDLRSRGVEKDAGPRRAEQVLRGPPLEESPCVAQPRGAEGGPPGGPREVAFAGALEAVAQRRLGIGRRGRVVQLVNGADGKRVVAREFQDVRRDRDAAGQGYRSNPSLAKRARSRSTSERIESGGLSFTSREIASTMASEPCVPSR